MSNSFEITFLGTGTSIGVPVIGCECAVCTSDDPKNQRLRSSIYVQTPEIKLVVDTGPDFRQQCLRENIAELDAAVFTHEHSDHIMGFDDLRRFTVRDHESVEIFALPETMRRLEVAFDYVFNGENRYIGYLKPIPHEISGRFEIGDLEITPLPVTHGKVETIGLLFSQKEEARLAYIPDAKKLAPESVEQIQGAPVLILDALQPNEHPTHLSIPESVEIARASCAGQTWFTHFSCRADYRVIEPDLPEGIRMAWDGLKIRL
ncbi:MAG: MBL fold metallo-hydrolase [Verrucomicrobiales bacterium]|nr:MBL fold metallo-hydrolase [Verrucomicrobiales bacterium]